MKRIVLIDDDVFIRDLVATKLKESGFDVVAAASIPDGLKYISEKPTDLVLLDLDLGSESGVEVLRHLRSDLQTTEIPIVIFSNNDDPEIKDEMMNAGANGFMVKAMMDVRELKSEIDQILTQ